MEEYIILQKVILWLAPLLFAITVHETAHGWVAAYLGDLTAKQLGRLSLNPAKHIDPIGTILVPSISFFLGGFIFGWAKPVPVNWLNLKKPRRDMAFVAAAGPGVNFLMALFWAMIAKIATAFNSDAIFHMGTFGITINLMLMVLNLIPIPPLDGSRIIMALLSPTIAEKFKDLENYGFFILILLLATGLLTQLIHPILIVITAFMTSLFGL